MPPTRPGTRVALFGGTFDPPHDGHLMASLSALRRIGVEQVWWLLTPGNPLKRRKPAPLADRLAACAAFADHPRIAVTGIEATFGTRYSIDTVRRILAQCPGVSFVWLMGADALAGFHRWRDWRRLAAMIPIAVVDRPNAGGALASPAAITLRDRRISESDAALLPSLAPPVWTFLHGPRIGVSSTALRSRKKR
ncbi:MAG: nicotinate-nucleotide adenylyltransferase [Bauldia sp.]|nr:nicotinate-nucleotide adenylyltransferase [Bauldia sp.]